jgi:ATP-dependent Lon protease
MIDPAFLDRLHYYLPGWEAPKLEARLFTDHFGFVSDYFAEAMRQLRKSSQVRAIDADFSLGSHLSARDERAVRKTVSGLVKILHPHGEWSHGDIREYLEFAMEGRRRVKEQLKKLAPHDYAKTAFSYLENDTGREVWVEVPEQPDELETDPEIDVAEVEQEQRRSTAELIESGESKTVEYKETARYNPHTGTVDKKLEHGVLKSVAGFMNAGGGVLLIGVHDKQTPTGMTGDYSTTGNNGRDGFENWLITRLDREIGKSATATLVDVTFEEFPEGDVCRLDIRPSPQPVYLGEDAEFFVRMGNSTRPYNTRDAMEYIRSRW